METKSLCGSSYRRRYKTDTNAPRKRTSK
ncbi:hypothetical protein CCACVL1_03324 [Corchorus capsularis]|uniref:Uncharacterized protein n=1 Tax=Corchorus capsularis TaxID=210143 RepID=A0A1R3K0N3_COCAP|nr:hypothetical protein CCACVL1_03324 [Corchorus capsularis]